ncbi:MAG TPA: MFS transporter [Candidatus Limnocylindria bacterium]|nr:MFS transporter [Candidatus Limnocylindria bacterium]
MSAASTLTRPSAAPASSPSPAPPLAALVVPCIVVFLGYLTVGMPLPVIPPHIHDALGFNAVVVGSVIGLQSFVTLVTRPFSGRIVDERGPKTALLAGGVLASLSGLTYLASLALHDRGASLAVLFAGRAILGVAEGLIVTGGLAYGIATLGAPRSGAVMVWIGIAMYSAMGGGAPLGAALGDARGFGAVALTVTLIPLLGIALAATLRPVRRAQGAPMPIGAVLRTVSPAGAGLALCSIGFGAITTFVVLAFNARHWGGASFAFTTFGIAFVLARLLFGHLPDKLGGAPVAIGALAVQIAGQLLLWLGAGPAYGLAGAALTGFGYSLAFPAFGVEAVKRIAPTSRGAALGIYVAFFDLGMGVTGPLSGMVASAFGYPAIYAFGALAALLSLAIACALRVTARRATT